MSPPAETVALSLWQNFYVIVGSAAGALVGLQFVTIALIANTRTRTDVQSINAFGTPNLVHFTSTLLIAAIMTAPWPSLSAAAVALAACGLFGLAYSSMIFHRARRQTAYKPLCEDWFWYAILPCGVYLTLTIAALTFRLKGHAGLFVIAASSLGLLLVGIRNAWDSVTHIVVGGLPRHDPADVK